MWGNSLVVQWLGLWASAAGSPGSVPGWELRSHKPHSTAKENKKSSGFPGGSVVKNCLPMQGTRVRALVQEDPTCRGATKPMCHNYWACTLEPESHNYRPHVPQLLGPARLEPVLYNKRNHHNEKSMQHNEEQPLLATTRGNPCTATETQHNQK